MTLTAADVGIDSPDDGPMSPRSDRPRRRSFTADYKMKILSEYDALGEPGAKGALLRREGLYSSHLVEWRRAQGAGVAGGQSTGRRAAKRTREQVEIDRLTARAERAERELATTKAALEVVGKAHALLEMLSESAATDRPSTT